MKTRLCCMPTLNYWLQSELEAAALLTRPEGSVSKRQATFTPLNEWVKWYVDVDLYVYVHVCICLHVHMCICLCV